MIAEILGENVSLDFHPSSMLSKAHQAERKADRMAASHDFIGALDYYTKAQELMEEVLQIPENRFVVESLQKQLAHLKKQPSVIRRKREDLARRKRQKSLAQKQKLELERVKASTVTEKMLSKDELDGDKNVVVATDDEEEEKDKTDSLLACLKDNMVEENDGFTYKTSELRKFFSTQQSESHDPEEKSNAEQPEKGDGPKTILIKKMERQNQELMDHICYLFKSWNSCEDENRQLKERIKLLEQETETLRSMKMQKSLLDHADVELSLPFQSEYFGDGPIPSLPSLPPLDLPNQLQMSGFYDEEEKHIFQEEM